MGNDFITQGIANAIECESSEDHIDILLNAEENGTDFTMDFD